MIRDHSSLKTFKLSVKSLGQESELGTTNIEIRLLHDSLRELRSLGQAKLTLLPPLRDSRAKVIQDLNTEEILYSGLQIESPIDGFRLVIRSLEDWLDRVAQSFFFTIELPKSFVITLQTSQPESLVQLLLLGESLLPSHNVYLNKAEAYIGDFGELTPCIKANLDLIRYRTKLPEAEAESLNIRVMEPFKDLEEKYFHFRQALPVNDEENLLSDDFWTLMQEKADVMRLPEIDFNFLKEERLKELYEEIKSSQREEVDELENQKKMREEKLMQYRKEFENLTLELVNIEAFSYNSSTAYEEVIKEIKAGEFGKGRLKEIRTFFEDITTEIDHLERIIISEICLLLLLSRSNLLN